MSQSQGTTVGLAIGIPCAVILIFVLAFWIRNHRKQKKEDRETELDVELRDDQSFNKFQEELHRPYNGPQDVAKTHPDEFVEKPSMASTESTSSTRVLDKTQKRTASSYDFYDTFIPMLPENKQYSSSALTEILPPAAPSHQDSSASSGAQSISNDKSLEHLAKKLNGPAFFEKLPSRSASFGLKQKSISASTNSSSDIINTLVQENAMNDHYTFDKKPEKHPYSHYASSASNGDSKLLTSSATTNLNELIEPKRSTDMRKVETSSLDSPFEDE